MNATGLLNRLLYFEAIGAAGTVYILKIIFFVLLIKQPMRS